ncbi:MAG: hypothetical protein HC919_13460 [Oscillatoriales cyanobacterium SM2_2_1]|nr:hypothetical protein [Oscillatoriales cyanobacterium SM2_2_1]
MGQDKLGFWAVGKGRAALNQFVQLLLPGDRLLPAAPADFLGSVAL